MGATSKLTKTVQEDICTALANMHTYESAAGYARVANSTLSLWRVQGRGAREKSERGEELNKDERRKLEFLEAVEQAEAEAVFNLHQVVIEAANVDANMALRLLQIRRPQDYAPPAQRTEVSGRDGGAVVFRDETYQDWSDDDLRRNLAAIGRAAVLAAGIGDAVRPDTDDATSPDSAA